MTDALTDALGLKFEPVALILTNNKPEGARQFKPGKWGCVMFMLAAAAKGATAVFDRDTYGCPGGGVGLGFGYAYKGFAGGDECFKYFLSVGNDQWEQGRQTAEQVKPYLRAESYDNFVHGERYLKSPERVQQWIDCLPIRDVEYDFVVFKPLSEINDEEPKAVIILADPDQISALTIMANYDRNCNDNVIAPYAAGCQNTVLYALNEADKDQPKAILGLQDISARVVIKRQLKADLMSFTAPWKMYRSMVGNAAGSFLERHSWKELRKMAD